MVNKIRPKAEISLEHNMDGREEWYDIRYACPCCGRAIWGYNTSNACDQCGTFYDWGKHEPRIVVTRHIEWD